MSMMLTLTDVERAQRFYAQGYWQHETLYGVLCRWAAKTPDAFALRDSRTRLTYAQALASVDALAARMHEKGLRPGDRVSIWLPSRLETALYFLACSRNGYICNTSLHRDYTCADIVALLRRAGSAGFIAQKGYGADGARADVFAMLQDLPRLKFAEALDPLQPGPETLGIAARCTMARPGAVPALNAVASPDRVVYLAFTSGTTGQPKGVMHSNNTLLANARAIAKDWRFDTGLVTYSLSPMSHNIAIVAMATTLVPGGEFVTHGPLDWSRTLDRILETGATYVLGVPTHGIDLLSEARQRGLDHFGSVKVFLLGGAPVPPALVDALRLLGVETQNAFGMTENCSFQYTRPGDPPEVVANSCGRPCEGFEIKLFSQEDRDRPVPQGEVGELACRGACLMLGYFGDQDATEAAFNADGWFMTGDLGRLDAAGNLTIVGRKKDVIIRGGHNIHPARIEDYATRHPAVAKAAAFAVADARLGEKVCLSVILRPAAKLTADDLLAHLNKLGLSKYDMPEYVLEMEQFPLTASGKVLKRDLADLVAKGALQPHPVRWKDA